MSGCLALGAERAEGIAFNEVILDSTILNVHWQRGGPQGLANQREVAGRDTHEASCGDSERRASG
ncbi:MAG: hypothetical protein LBJ41_03320 [Treponema sp.]|nr:hypothetical protein [Treponema sp.]